MSNGEVLGEGGAAKFRLTAMGGCLALPGIDDSLAYRRTMHAIAHVGVTADQQLEVLQVLAAILHLGNIALVSSVDSPLSAGAAQETGDTVRFSGADMAQISNEDAALRVASRLLNGDLQSR